MRARLSYTPERLAALRDAFGDLAAEPIFTTWRVVERNGKRAKLPTHPAGTPGITLRDALATFERDRGLAGAGVKLGRVPGRDVVVFGIDYDGAAKGPLPESFPRSDTYAERSPSGGDRFHVLGLYRGAPLEGRRAGAVELYSEGRFFTLTGERLNGARILEIDPLPFYAAIGVPDPRPYGAPARAEPGAALGGPVAEGDLSNRERELLEAVRGIEDADESKRDFAVCAELVARGATDAEAARVLKAAFPREKLDRPDYVARTLGAAREARLEAFRADSRAIGEGIEPENPPPILTLEQALAELVFVSDGSQVVFRNDPRQARSLLDFDNLMAASVVHTGAKGRPQTVVRVWLKHPKRETVDARTFRAGGPLFCQSPDDVRAMNTWRAPPRAEPPADWRQRARAFVEHINFLVPVKSEREWLLDWLAHLEQRPGELPHVHPLMIARAHGVGRNWLACVLARVWPGVVALDVDLPALLNGGFNGRLSRKVLAVVNEINEGAAASAYRYSNRLRTLLTDETRLVNPKYGRQYSEFNSMRWLLFSNHETALPLDRFDRRIYVIANPGAPRPAEYYARIYGMAGDPAFLASVRELLRTRTIARFNPGAHAPLTETKRRVIEATTPEPDLELERLVREHPSACITSERLLLELWGPNWSARERAALRYITGRLGVRRLESRVYVAGAQRAVWLLRDFDRWSRATPDAVAKEILRGEKKEGPR